MPRRQVADANQVIRDLRNQIHSHEQQVVLPLRARIAELERANALLALRVDRAEGLHKLYRDAWESMVRLTNATLPLASGKS